MLLNALCWDEKKINYESSRNLLLKPGSISRFIGCCNTQDTPQSSQRVGAQEVVVANVLVSCDIDHLRTREEVFLKTSSCSVLMLTADYCLFYRLVGDDQLDDRQGVEHSDGGDVPGEKITVIIMVYYPTCL